MPCRWASSKSIKIVSATSREQSLLRRMSASNELMISAQAGSPTIKTAMTVVNATASFEIATANSPTQTAYDQIIVIAHIIGYSLWSVADGSSNRFGSHCRHSACCVHICLQQAREAQAGCARELV